MSYDQWKTTDPADEELGDAKQPGQDDELEAVYEMLRLKEALEHVLEQMSEHSRGLERVIERQEEEIKRLKEALESAIARAN
jgi:predicted RNase H-like nuclease (RuvC/YqgF family)